MICKYSQFWSYIINEPSWVIESIKEKLTIKEQDLQTKLIKTCILYQIHSSVLGYETIRIPTGLCDYIGNLFNIEIEYKGNEYNNPEQIRESIIEICNYLHGFNPQFEIRDYQIEGPVQALKGFHGTLHFGVATGKTTVLAIIVHYLKNDNILILNNNRFILRQIYDRLISLGIKEEDISTGFADLSKRIQIVSTQTLHIAIKKQIKIKEYLETVNTILYDEAQHCQAITFFQPLLYCNPDNLRHVIGFSGSLYRDPKFKYDNSTDMVTTAVLGEPAMYYEMKDSIEEKTIAQPYAYFINYEDKPLDYQKYKWLKGKYFAKYNMAITGNFNRNKAGLAMLKYLHDHNMTTLALVSKKSHGHKLQIELDKIGIKSLFIAGNETIFEYTGKIGKKTKKPIVDKRTGDMEDIKKALKNGYKIIFGSSVLNEGVDCPEFDAGVLFIAGVSPISLVQQTGRVSRKKEGLNISLVIDFNDNKSDYVFDLQCKKRKQLLAENGIKLCNNVYEFLNIVEEREKSKLNQNI
jgi:superfamily II DNA or RNA helicase